jgi:hypothetical protein
VSNSRGARPVTCAITTKSDLRTLRLERLTETSKNFSDVALSRDRDLHVHLEITAKTRTDLAQKKSPEGPRESAYVSDRGETWQILRGLRCCTCRWLVVPANAAHHLRVNHMECARGARATPSIARLVHATLGRSVKNHCGLDVLEFRMCREMSQ